MWPLGLVLVCTNQGSAGGGVSSCGWWQFDEVTPACCSSLACCRSGSLFFFLVTSFTVITSQLNSPIVCDSRCAKKQDCCGSFMFPNCLGMRFASINSAICRTPDVCDKYRSQRSLACVYCGKKAPPCSLLINIMPQISHENLYVSFQRFSRQGVHSVSQEMAGGLHELHELSEVDANDVAIHTQHDANAAISDAAAGTNIIPKFFLLLLRLGGFWALGLGGWDLLAVVVVESSQIPLAIGWGRGFAQTLR